MNFRQIALLIPKKYRDKILEENLIYKAIATPEDRHMTILFTIWVEFVEPGKKEDGGCLICLGKILDHYRALKDTFIDLAKEDNLLEL